MFRRRGGRPATIALVVVKNTSALDTVLPLLWALRRADSDVRLVIQYCVASRRQVLRDGRFVDDFCERHDIEQRDWSDDLRSAWRWLAPLWRRVFTRAGSDARSIRLSFSEDGWSVALRHLVARHTHRVERVATRVFADPGRGLRQADPDTVLLDNRARTDFVGRDRFFNWLDRRSRPVVLVPHAPHYIHPHKDEFCPFDGERGRLMPSYTEHWSPFPRGRPWLALDGSFRSQFHDIGYPGLDEAWIDHCQVEGVERPDVATVQLLVLLRKFVPEGVGSSAVSDPFTLSFEETRAFVGAVADGVRASAGPVRLVVKPHPSSSRGDCEALLRKAGLSGSQWRISYDPFYSLRSQIDGLVSQFSTLVVTCVLHGIPTVLSVCTALRYSEESWGALREVYGSLSRRTDDIRDLPTAIADLVASLRSSSGDTAAEQDAERVRSFFPDGACGRAMARIRVHLSAGPSSVKDESGDREPSDVPPLG